MLLFRRFLLLFTYHVFLLSSQSNCDCRLDSCPEGFNLLRLMALIIFDEWSMQYETKTKKEEEKKSKEKRSGSAMTKSRPECLFVSFSHCISIQRWKKNNNNRRATNKIYSSHLPTESHLRRLKWKLDHCDVVLPLHWIPFVSHVKQNSNTSSINMCKSEHVTGKRKQINNIILMGKYGVVWKCADVCSRMKSNTNPMYDLESMRYKSISGVEWHAWIKKYLAL